MNGLMRGLRGAVLLGAGIAITGCSQLGSLGSLGNVLGGVLSPAGSGNQVYATVRYVDTRSQVLQVTTQNGQTCNIYFDQNTQVVYQNQRYNVTSLEQGDEVAMRIQQDQRGNYYTDYIQVTRSVQNNGGGYNNTGGYGTYNGTVRLEGNVQYVDYNRGLFSVNTNQGTVTVSLPYNVSATDANYFRNLRQGQYVRVEGTMTAQNQLQFQRFY